MTPKSLEIALKVPIITPAMADKTKHNEQFLTFFQSLIYRYFR